MATTAAFGLPPGHLWSRYRFLGLVLACALIVANSLYSFITFRELQRANDLVEHTQQVLLELYDVRGATRAADTDQRAYVVAGDEKFLVAFREAIQSASAGLAKLRDLVADNPGQQHRLAGVEALIRDHFAELSQGIGTQVGKAGASLSATDLLARIDKIDRIGAGIVDMQAEEQRLFRLREAVADHSAATAEIALIVGTVGSLLLIGIVVRLMQSEARQRTETQAQLATLNAELEQRVASRTAELASSNAALQARELALRQNEGQLRLFIDWAPAAIAMFDRDMRYVAVSRRYRDDLRLGERELIGRSHYDVFPELPEPRRQAHRRSLAGEIEHGEGETHRRADGSTDWIRWEMRPWYDGQGAIGGIILFSEVITERRKLEQQLRQAQKMEAVGQLTGGVAHDFNNLLVVITGNFELLEDALSDRPELQELARSGMRAADRGATLTRSLLAFSRKQALSPTQVELNRLIREVESMLIRALGETIDVEVIAGGNLWRCMADPGQLQNVLLNLAINARDAMPDGGKLTIETSNARLDQEYAAQHAEVTPGQYVVLAVSDTGTGMPPEVAERAFDPFFTTKDIGKGSGLGLSMIHGFVKQSGGHVKIYSEVGLGTTVKVYLPRSYDDAAAPQPEPEPAPLPSGMEMVLLVEDDTEVRKLAARLLVTLGYSVLEASSAAEALVIVSSDAKIDLLLTDVVLPGGNHGRNLADQAQALRPGIRVLYMSGYTENSILHHGRLDPGVQLLQKPFRKKDLAEKVRSALDRQRS